MNDFMEILEKIDKIDLDSQSQLVDIINKRYVQSRRDSFIDETIKSIDSIKSGNYKTGSSEDLFKELNI
jgi:hypothetical protein